MNQSYYQRHKEHLRETHRRYYAEHPEKFSKSRLQYAKDHPERQRAQTFSGQYVQAKTYCEKCGATGCKLEKHHPDYSKPLEVLTLCKSCHRAIHRELKAKGIDLSVPAERFKDRHCNTCGTTWPTCGKSRPLFKGRYVCTFWVEKKHDEANKQ